MNMQNQIWLSANTMPMVGDIIRWGNNSDENDDLEVISPPVTVVANGTITPLITVMCRYLKTGINELTYINVQSSNFLLIARKV